MPERADSSHTQSGQRITRSHLAVLLVVLSFLSLPRANATATVSGKVTDPSTTAAGVQAFVLFELTGCGNNPARATQPGEQATLLLSKRFTVSAAGTISGTIVRNDQIQCASTTGNTRYNVTIFYNGVPVPGTKQCYNITGATFDLNSATPCNTSAVVTPPTGDTVYQRLDGGNQATGNYVPNAAGLRLGATNAEWDLIGRDVTCRSYNNIRCAAYFSGADAGAKICAAAANLPTTGGYVDARFEGNQAITTLCTIDRPTVLMIGNAVFAVSGTGGFSVATTSLRVFGQMTTTNNLLRGTTFQMNKAGGLFQFPTGASAAVENFELAYFQVQGGGGSYDNYVVDVPSTAGGSFTGSQGRWKFHDLWIANMGSPASTKATLNFGNSIYWLSVEYVTFGNNAGGDINTGYADDANITHDMFSQLTQYNPHVRAVGGTKTHITENEFEGNGNNNQPDILLYTESANQRGFVDILYNKFGSETENGTRTAKIRAYSASFPTALISQVNLHGNQFTGTIGGSTPCAIQVDNPISTWTVTGNGFTNIATLVCDNQTTSNIGAYGGIFRNNTVSTPKVGTKCSTNGGRGFWDFDQPECSDSIRRKTTEQPELRNRLLYSEAIDNAAWTKSAGITTTTGQADPNAGTTAVRLNNDGTTSGAFASGVVSNAALGNRVYLRFWAKAGTLDRLDFSYWDTTSTTPNDGLFKIKLDSTWREYKVSFTTLNAAHAQELRLHVGDQGQQNTGNLYVWGVQVSDYDSDYVKTSGATFADTTSGTAFQRNVNAKRIVYRSGTALAATDFVLNASWGNTATVTGVAGTDEGFVFTVTSNGAGLAANPQITLTFKDGAWPAAPVCELSRAGGTDANFNGQIGKTTATTNVLFVIPFTPAGGGATSAFQGTCKGKGN